MPSLHFKDWTPFLMLEVSVCMYPLQGLPTSLLLGIIFVKLEHTLRQICWFKSVNLRATLSLRPDCVGFVMEKSDTGTGYLHALGFSPDCVTSPRFNTHSFTYHWQFMNLLLLCPPACSQVTVPTELSILLSFSGALTSFCNHCRTAELQMYSKFGVHVF